MRRGQIAVDKVFMAEFLHTVDHFLVANLAAKEATGATEFD